MSSKVTSFFGESLSEAVFAQSEDNVDLKEQISNWTAYMLKEVSVGRRELQKNLLENFGKIDEKELRVFERRVKDVVSWLWFNVFVAGDKNLYSQVEFAGNESEVVEFNDRKLLEDTLNQVLVEKRNERDRLVSKKRKIQQILNLEGDRGDRFSSQIEKLKLQKKTYAKDMQKRAREVKDVSIDPETKKLKRARFFTIKARYDLLKDEVLPDLAANLRRKVEDVDNAIREKEAEIKDITARLPEDVGKIGRMVDKQKQLKGTTTIGSTVTPGNKPNVSVTSAKRKSPQPTEKKPRVEATDDQLRERISKDKRNVFQLDKLTDEKEEKTIERAVVDVRNLREKVKEQSAASSFMKESDFGRVYIEQRANYIANTYGGKTREKMLNVFNALKQDYEDGKPISPVVQKYFEKGTIKKVDDVMKIGRTKIQTTDPTQVQVGVKNYVIAGERIKPTPIENEDMYRELELYEDVLDKVDKSIPRQKTKLPNGREITIGRLPSARRIVETEVVAAYHMGRLHALFRSGENYVRWINSEINIKYGKVCLICTTRAVGTSRKLRDLKVKESLSGIYTLEEILTDRQLSIPQHPMCSCWVRPLNNKEKDILASITGLPSGEQKLTVASIAAIGGASVEGISNTVLAEKGGDRTSWWTGGIAVGGTAAAIGFGLWYLRKSMTSKYAADLLQRRGKGMVEKMNKKGIAKIPRVVPTQEVLDNSLKLADDVNLETNILRPKYTSAEIKKHGVIDEPLPDLGTLRRALPELRPTVDIPEKIDDSLEKIIVADQVYMDVKRADTLPVVKRLKLQEIRQEIIEDLNTRRLLTFEELPNAQTDTPENITKQKSNIYEDLVDIGDDEIRSGYTRWFNHLNVEEDRLLSKLNREIDKLAQTPETKQIFTSNQIRDINERFINLQPTAPSAKKAKVDIKQYFSDLEKTQSYLTRKLDSLAGKTQISKTEYEALQKRISGIKRQKTKIEKILSKTENSMLLTEAEYMLDNADENIREQAARIFDRDLKNAISSKVYVEEYTKVLTQRLEELKTNTPTYGQKVIRGEVADKFVGEVKSNRSPVKVKRLALNERKDTIKELDSIVNLLRGTRAISKDGEVTLGNTLEEILTKLNLDENQLDVFGDNFVDIFVNDLDRKGKLTIVNRLRSLLIDETRRIQNAEFSRFQQKWAMFGSPR